MTYVVRMRWAINYRMGYLVHKLGSIQKPRFTVVRKISRKKLHEWHYMVRSEQSTIISKNLLLAKITFKNVFLNGKFCKRLYQNTL